MLGIAGIILALALLIVLGYKGYNIVLLTMLCGVIVAVFNGMPILETFTGVFMGQFGVMMGMLLPMLLFGAVLGQLYSDSGAAQSIGRLVYRGACCFRGEKQIFMIVLLVVVVTFVMTIGGISGLVLLYLLAPLLLSICRSADIPRRFIPMLMFITPMALVIPGTTQMYNTVPQSALGTLSTSCLVPGVICSLLVTAGNVVVGYLFISRAKARGEHFDGLETEGAAPEDGNGSKTVPVWLAFIPLIVVFVLFNAFHLDIVVALVAGIVLSMLLFAKWFGAWRPIVESMGTGAMNGCSAMAGFAGLMGFAAVVTATPAFESFVAMISSMQGDPLVVAAVSVAIITGMTNSAETGALTTISAFGEMLMERGLTPAMLHRVATMTGTTLDTLPTNPGVHISLGLSKTTMKQSYFPIFVHTVCLPIVGVILFIILLKLVPAWGLV